MLDQTPNASIKGQLQQNFAVSTTAAKSLQQSAGTYDVWCDVDTYVRVAPVARNGTLVTTPNRAEDVTASNGYIVYANNVVSLVLGEGDVIGAISTAPGTLRFMKTG